MQNRPATLLLLLASTPLEATMMAGAEPPLSVLRRLAATEQRPPLAAASFELTGEETRDVSGKVVSSGVAQVRPKKYCKFDDIRATLAASRKRSYEQGRNGCCGKAAEYLSGGGPPAGSPWSKKSESSTSSGDVTRTSDGGYCVDGVCYF